jgi:hypothetical protein
MGLLDAILGAQGGGGPAELARQFGLSDRQTGDALKQLVPALNAGVRRNTQSPQGLESLLGALKRGNHERYLDQPEALRDRATVDDGNKILGHILGSKDASRQVAQKTSERTGIDSGILKKMLPVVATMVMGSLSKNKAEFADSGSGSSGMLGKLLDADGDGSIMDDIAGMLGKSF